MKLLIDTGVPTMTFILLFAVGLNLKAADFARLRRQPALVLLGLFVPPLLLPPVALILSLMFNSNPEIAAGILIIAACPIGGISNSYSNLAKASTALSITLTGLSCLFAMLTIPLVGNGLELATDRSLGLEVPVPILIGQLAFVLALPVVLGIWVQRSAPKVAERYHATLQRIAFLGIGLVLLALIAMDTQAFRSDVSTTVPLAALFIVMSMMIGWLAAMLVTQDPRNRFTIAAEFGTRNVAVATAMAVTVLGRVEFAHFAATYFLTELPLMLLAVMAFRRFSVLA